MKLSVEELQRYARHIVLADIGGAGQQKLKTARVLVIGAGGLGSPVLQYLAAATLTKDDGRVIRGNLRDIGIDSVFIKIDKALCNIGQFSFIRIDQFIILVSNLSDPLN